MMQRQAERIEKEDLLVLTERILVSQGETISAAALLLQQVVDISELLIAQEEDYEFAHLSFQEYLAAAHVAVKPKEREAWLYGRIADEKWKDVLLLYAGRVRKPTPFIREVLRQEKVNLAYACLQQTTKRVDAELRAELEGLVSQVQDARYAELERYLKNGEWEQADEETYRLMITEVGKEEGQWFESSELLNFPCEPLKVIDGLWVKYSDGRFGFSVQKEIYLACGGVPDGKYYEEAFDKYYEAVGWRSIVYEISSPSGHLPWNFVCWADRELLLSSSSLASRLVNCNL